MKTQVHEIEIKAPRETVWERLFGEDTFGIWTALFAPGSYFKGSWDEGSEIFFLVPGEECGMASVIDENIKNEYMCIKHIGVIEDGKPLTDPDEVPDWSPAFEKYWLTDSEHGGTHLKVASDTAPEWDEMFAEVWPKSLARLAAICEASPDQLEIWKLINEWDSALAAKDADAMMHRYADEFVLFDISRQHVGVEACKEMWNQCFPYFSDELKIERKETHITVVSDTAVMHGLTRLRGQPEEVAESPMARSWIRTSVVYARQDGEWRVLHEHVSYPVDCESQEIEFLLDQLV